LSFIQTILPVRVNERVQQKRAHTY